MLAQFRCLLQNLIDRFLVQDRLEVYAVSDIMTPSLEFTLLKTCINPTVYYENPVIRISDYSYTLNTLQEGSIVKFVHKRVDRRTNKEEIILDGPMFKIVNISNFPTFLNIVGVVEYEDKEHRQLMHLCYKQAFQSGIIPQNKQGD